MVKNEKMSSIIIAVEFVLLGISHSIIEKAIYHQKSIGLPKYGTEPKLFCKPWFFNTISLTSMLTSFVLYEIYRCFEPKKLLPIFASVTLESVSILILPALFDIFQHITSSLTVLYVGVSIDQMFRGGTIVITALISKIRLKKTYMGYQWLGMSIIVAAMILVGIAALLNATLDQGKPSSKRYATSPGKTAIILFLKIVSLFGYSFKLVIEEESVARRKINHLLVVAFEGCWSTIMLICIFLPIFQFVKGTDEGRGLHEDTIDTFEMLKNNKTITILVVVVFIVFCCYNNVSMNLTGRVSAVTKLVVDSARTFVLWAAQIILYYSLDSSEKLRKYKNIGEPWRKYSYVQLMGFFTLICGMCVYRGILKFKCLTYPPPQDEFTRLQNVSLETYKESSHD